jgi:hypothetical protein
LEVINIPRQFRPHIITVCRHRNVLSFLKPTTLYAEHSELSKRASGGESRRDQ